MSTSTFPLITAPALRQLLYQDDIIIIDASGGPDAKKRYEKRHIEGARFIDLETQLADTSGDPARGGRHPLPAVTHFAETLSMLGITKSHRVVIYDDKSGANAAARLWWMLRAAGHPYVQVLDGGLQAAEEHGLPINDEPVIINPSGAYTITRWTLPQALMDEVEIAANDVRQLVIDVRDAERYNGLTEPLDLIAGHIPGAVNVPYWSNLRTDGYFKPAAELKAFYLDILEDKSAHHTVVHCGSGVTACHTLLAIAAAGLDIPKLYVGSWSEWSRNDKPMVTANPKHP